MASDISKPKYRDIVSIASGMAASDGAGVRLTRMVGTPYLDMVDPFLMLDAFRSDQADDYIAGFPDHPHRGFETVTYLLAGKMRHKDNAGHEGVIEAGGVQWMTAGRGIIHSEMPEQEDGLLHGYQLWVNLPASAKMCVPTYQEFTADQIPEDSEVEGVCVKVIAGTSATGIAGPVTNPHTSPIYMDVSLEGDGQFDLPVPLDHGGFIHVISGRVQTASAGPMVEADQIGILGRGEAVRLRAVDGAAARLLLITGRLLNEPVARHGPFVMNTTEELYQAYEDYQAGRF